MLYGPDDCLRYVVLGSCERYCKAVQVKSINEGGLIISGV